MRTPWKLSIALACLLLLTAQALAARGYERVSFSTSNGAKLSLSTQGKVLTLTFTAPQNIDPKSIEQRLGTRVQNIAVSPDRKKVTLTLDQPYRTRQFISGNAVGFDLITGDTPAPKPILTTKDQPKSAPPEPAKPKPEVAKETPAPKPEAVVQAPEPSPKPEPKIAEPVKDPMPEPPAMAPSKADGKFTVTTRATDDGIWMMFPFETRTAAAAYRRGDDLWLVFSEPQKIETSLLHSTLPKAIVSVDQFTSAQSTILRLSTDGTLNITARQPKGSYRWNVLLSPRAVPPTLESEITVQSEDDEKFHLLLALFDGVKPLRFYDPRIGDLVLVFPAYEEGRGVSAERRYPAITVLSTQQGVTITSNRDDLATSTTRIGIKLFTPSGLSISPNLPTIGPDATPIAKAKSFDLMFPYETWFVPAADFQKVRAERLRAIANATPAAKPDALYDMVTLALSNGLATEALGYLDLIRLQYADYYRLNKLSLLRAASNLLLNRPQEAMMDASMPELEGLAEAALWRDAIGLYFPVVTPVAEAPKDVNEQAVAAGALNNAGVNNTEAIAASATVQATAKPFDYLQYNQQYIRFYPPKLRQHLAQLAAEYYLKANDADKAVAVYDTLNRDGILKPVQSYAELALGTVAARKSQVKQALEILSGLAAQQSDRFIQTRAAYEQILVKLKAAMLTPEQATEEIEGLRLRWRGDWFERQMLDTLVRLYSDSKQYDQVLRTQRAILQAFPNDPDTLTITGDMGQLFADMFLGDLAGDMPPLKSLALFYEFRDLTPIGDNGDLMIQRLADRLAAVDLLDRAAQLLDHQVKVRMSGEARARVGARLALLYLLNQEPARALDTLETTNYGSAPADLTRERQQLLAQSLSALGRHEDALAMLYTDTSKEGNLLRLDILWAMQDWPNVANQAEDLLTARPNLTDPLSERETHVLVKLALAYSFEGDYPQLGYLRDYYMGLVPDSPMKQIFAFITNDTSPLDPEDISLVTSQIKNTEGFLGLFREKLAKERLSEVI